MKTESIAKFNVGERVRLLKDGAWSSGFDVGSEYFVISYDADDCEYRISKYVNKSDEKSPDDYAFVYASQIEAANECSCRISKAEVKIAALEAEVAALKKANEPKPKGICLQTEIARTPNQRRADAIKRARAFIDSLKTERNGTYRVDHQHMLPGNPSYGFASCNVTFFVNAEKRTVVALMVGDNTDKIRSRGIAKCMPGDVFNADIGKAIALGKACGKDVTEFYDVPNPSELVAGMVVDLHWDDGSYFGSDSFDEIKPIDRGTFLLSKNQRGLVNGGGGCSMFVIGRDKILNDTDAVYE